MPKMIVYTGQCRSFSTMGQKFTATSKTKVVSDEIGSKFSGLVDFTVHDIIKPQIVPEVDKAPKTAIVPDVEETTKKLMNLRLEQLQEMCELKNLPTDGIKSELVARILTPQE